jgi:DNA-binding MarR family transcriptional regulator
MLADVHPAEHGPAESRADGPVDGSLDGTVEPRHVTDRPIGWWIKHVDQLIEESFDRVLAGEGIGRKHWRVLNALAGGVATLPELDRALAPFREAGPDLTVVLEQLVSRGWARRSASRLSLTQTGAGARERLVKAIAAHRWRVTEGIDERSLRATVATLRQIAGNLAVGR